MKRLLAGLAARVRAFRGGAALLDEVETLRGLNQLRLKRLKAEPGEVLLTWEDPAQVWEGLGLWFIEQLDATGAHNCMQLDVIVRDGGPHDGEGVRLTLERAQAKSPMEMRAEAVREVERLRKLLEFHVPAMAPPAHVRELLRAARSGPEFHLGDVPKWWQDRKPVPGRGRPKKTP